MAALTTNAFLSLSLLHILRRLSFKYTYTYFYSALSYVTNVHAQETVETIHERVFHITFNTHTNGVSFSTHSTISCRNFTRDPSS